MENQIRKDIANLQKGYVNINEIDAEITKLQLCVKDIESNNEGSLINTMITALNTQIRELKNIRNGLGNANNLIFQKIRSLEIELQELLEREEKNKKSKNNKI